MCRGYATKVRREVWRASHTALTRLGWLYQGHTGRRSDRQQPNRTEQPRHVLPRKDERRRARGLHVRPKGIREFDLHIETCRANPYLPGDLDPERRDDVNSCRFAIDAHRN